MVREFDFYIVPTPIGNIMDITYRAIEVLKNVDIIACEDTRNTQKLLNHYKIKTKCISYHKYNEKERVALFISLLSEKKKIALVSDAGTPLICDPGGIIIEELVKQGFSVTSLPGACAIPTFLSLIHRTNEEFSFIGFMPRTENQITEIVKKYSKTNLVFYDSPERILKTLKTVKNIRGDIKVSLGRELSKLFEEVKTAKISDLIEYYKDGVKGEIVCMLYADETNSDNQLIYKVKELKAKGFKDKEISVILSTLFDYNKNEVYKKSLEL